MKYFKLSLLITLALVCLCAANIHPADPFDASDVAERVRAALVNKQDRMLTNILPYYTGSQRVDIAHAYEAKYKRNLIEDFKSQLSGDFKDLMINLVTPLHLYFAKELWHEAQPLTGHSNAIEDIVLNTPHADLVEVEKWFKNVVRPGDRDPLGYKLIILPQNVPAPVTMGCFEGKRSESDEVDVESAIADAKTLKEIGRKNPHQRGFNDDRKFQNIFVTRSIKQFQKIMEEYQKLYGEDIVKCIEGRGFASEYERGYLNMLKVYRSVPKYFASRLYDTVHGPGTADRELMRILISRSEIDLNEIKDEFKKMYGDSLAYLVEDDTSGEYQRALLAIINSK